MTKKKSLHTSWLHVLLFIFVLIVLDAPDVLHKEASIHMVLNFISFICLIYFLFIYYLSKEIKKERIVIISTIYFAYIILITMIIFNGKDVNYSEPIRILSLTLFCCISLWTHKKDFLTASFIFFTVFSILELPLEIIHPYVNSETTVNWLIHSKNYVVRYFMPGIFFTIWYSIDRYDKVLHVSIIPTIFSLIANIILANSSTGIVGLFVFAVMCFLYKNRKPKYVTITSSVILSVSIALLIYFLNFQEHFSYIIINYLGKDTTLTGRVDIWGYAFALFMTSPLYGTGLNTIIETDLFSFHHPHQYWLNSLVVGGIIGTAMLLSIYLIASYKLKPFQNTKSGKIILFTIVSFIFMGVDESLTNSYMLIPLLNIAGSFKHYENYVISSKYNKK